MKRVIVAALIAVLGLTSCTQPVIGFVPPAWGGI